MDITNELGSILFQEEAYIKAIKDALDKYDERITDKAEHDLRMGFRTAALVDLKLKRCQQDQGLAMRPEVVMENTCVIVNDPCVPKPTQDVC